MKFSLGKKIIAFLIAFAIILSAIGIAVSYSVISRMNDQYYMNRADEIAATVARVIDADSAQKLHQEALTIFESSDTWVLSDKWGSPEFEAYVGKYAHLAQTPEYQKLMAELRSLQEVNDVDCLYTAFIEPKTETSMYLVDAAEEDACPIGCIDPVYEFNRRALEDINFGFPAYITDTPEYGWLVTAAAPVYTADGSVACYAFADLSMDAIKQQQTAYIVSLSLALVGITAVVCIVAAFIVRNFITRPLNTLSHAAEQYCSPDDQQRSTFVGLDIHTKDEIENLHESMIQMEHDIDTHIDNLMKTQEQLKDTRMEAEHMSALAHKDALTGVRNKLAFDQEALRLEQELDQGQKEFGIAIVDLNDLKFINDTYGHDCGNVSLKCLSNLTCSVFVHSPVFRIGGDEFAIVLRNNDYDKIEELVEEFNAMLVEYKNDGSATLEPWERISAAVGYALYDEKCDTGVDDVFRRADQDMYLNKKKMKGDRLVR